MPFALASSKVNGLKLSVGTIAAAGTTVADATAVTSGYQKVTGADATKGVVLPQIDTVDIGTVIFIDNDVAAVLKVYGYGTDGTDGTINGGAAAAAGSLTANSVGIFVAVSTTAWRAIEPAELA